MKKYDKSYLLIYAYVRSETHSSQKRYFTRKSLFKKQQSTNNNKKKPLVNVVILENVEKIPDHIPLDFTE